IQAVPQPVLGGISLLLFGVIAVSGLRMLVEKQVDYNKSQNLILTCVVLGIGIGGATINILGVRFKGMGFATVVAIALSVCFKIIDLLKLSNERPEKGEGKEVASQSLKELRKMTLAEFFSFLIWIAPSGDWSYINSS